MSQRARTLYIIVATALALGAWIGACGGTDDPPPPPTTTTGTGGDGAGGTGTPTGSGTTTGTPGGGGTGGQPPLTGDDECPGDLYVLTAPTSLVLPGDTSTASDHYDPPCGDGGSGPDLVYAFDVQEAGSLKLTVTVSAPSTLEPILLLRKDMGGGAGGAGGAGPDPCADDASNFRCSSGGTMQEFIFLHVEPGMYYVIIDGENASSGAYILNVEFDAPACGDGVLNPPPCSGAGGAGGAPADCEQCDDGNNDPNDGCDDCKFVYLQEGDDCPGEGLMVYLNQPVVVSGSTVPFQDDYLSTASAGCGWANFAGSKDRLYEILPQADGTITASVGLDVTGAIDICDEYGLVHSGCWDRVLYAYEESDCGGIQIACSDSGDWEAVEIVSFPVTNGGSYSLVIDGLWDDPSSYGTYNLHVELVP